MSLPKTLTTLPTNYHEQSAFRLTNARQFLWLNLASIPLLLLATVFFAAYLWLYYRLLNGFLVIKSLPDEMPMRLVAFLLVAMLPLHEYLHGLGMQYYGHQVRYGVKWTKGVLYATSDQGLFGRHQFIRIALAPLIGISLLCMGICLFVPASIGLCFSIVAILNATGSIGDLWMAWIVRKYPPDTLIRDEEDGIRIFCPQAQR